MSKLFPPRGASYAAKGSLEAYVRRKAGEYALVAVRSSPEEFLRFCVDGLPAGDGRDTRRQRLVRSMRRLDGRGDLPFRVDGGGMLVFA